MVVASSSGPIMIKNELHNYCGDKRTNHHHSCVIL